jgi:hypothetical protein
MGYSSSAKASMVLDALMAIVRDTPSSNIDRDHFYEIGRENSSGAITGKVWKFTSGKYGDDKRMAVSAGSFRIEATGKIVRFPATTKAERNAAYVNGMRKYAETFMPAIRDINPSEVRYSFTVIE